MSFCLAQIATGLLAARRPRRPPSGHANSGAIGPLTALEACRPKCSGSASSMRGNECPLLQRLPVLTDADNHLNHFGAVITAQSGMSLP